MNVKKTQIFWKGIQIGRALGPVPTKESVLLFLRLPLSSPHLELRIIEANGAPSDPRSLFTDTDGGVFGVRFFDFLPGQSRCFLVSPTSRFVWESPEGFASDFRNAGAVRGHVGFHAAWPCSLELWQDSPIDHKTCEVKALVKGHGDLVLGEVGWRSERMTILSVQSLRAEEIAKHYGVNAIKARPSNRGTEAKPKFDFVADVDYILHPRSRKIPLSEFT